LTILSSRRYHRGRHKYSENAPPLHLSLKTEPPFVFKVHKSLKTVLERIGVPEKEAFTPDPFQLEALEALNESDVLVTAPTGAGKTYIAVQAIETVFRKGGRSWYASPLKALSNAKYEELSQAFGPENVGILTGDRKENVQAPVIIGTTEILRNQLYDTMHRGEDLSVDLVVLDEAHFLGDKDRGVVWEEVLIYLPSRVRLLLLSATIRNAREICDWLEWHRHAPCRRVAVYERPVPLYPLFLFPSGELAPLSTRRGMLAKIKTVDRKSFSRRDLPDVGRLLTVLREANLLPAIFFLKSRSDCEKAIAMCGPSPESSNRGGSREFSRRLKQLLTEFPFLGQHQHLSILKNARVGAHHGGQLPHWKIFLEKLMQEGFLDAIFSTSTVAAGVNFPARSVVVLQSDRFNGKEFVELSATDLLQMTGRAGRRGMDEIGFVMVIPGAYQDPQLIHDLLRSPPDSISSQIRINFSMVLNLLLSHTPEEIRALFASSLATYQHLNEETEIARELDAARKEIENWLPDMACGSLERLVQVRPLYGVLKDKLRRGRSLFKRQSSLNSLNELLEAGRVFLSKRGTPYVALAAPEMDRRSVEAVRLAMPLRYRRGQLRSFRVGFHRIRNLGEKLENLPVLKDRSGWEIIAARLASKPFRAVDRKPPLTSNSLVDTTEKELAALASQKAALPCESCKLFGPCQKTPSHPFSHALQDFFDRRAKINSIQEQLWHSFGLHLHFLQAEGYVDNSGHLTTDGLWASKLRLDQPLLISECIRRAVFPSDDPQLLAALVAPFVMDRDRPGDMQLSNLVWKYPDIAKPFFRMLQSLQPLRTHLETEGFTTPPLPFWTLVTVYHWALGRTWEEVREIAGVDEGDLAMVVLRTADHLRQIESLAETHPRLAASARQAIELILREPVLIV
jgi:ATP-dependent RNA helicase HelY